MKQCEEQNANITSRSIILGYRPACFSSLKRWCYRYILLIGYDVVLLWCSNIWKFNNHTSIWNLNIWKSERAFVVHLKGDFWHMSNLVVSSCSMFHIWFLLVCWYQGVSLVKQQRHLCECLDFLKVFGKALHERWREEFGLRNVSLVCSFVSSTDSNLCLHLLYSYVTLFVAPPGWCRKVIIVYLCWSVVKLILPSFLAGICDRVPLSMDCDIAFGWLVSKTVLLSHLKRKNHVCNFFGHLPVISCDLIKKKILISKNKSRTSPPIFFF